MSLTCNTPDCAPHPTHHGYVSVPLKWMPDDSNLRIALMGYSMPCDECPTRECGWNPGDIESSSPNGECLAGMDNTWVRIETAVTLRMNRDAMEDIHRR